MKAGAMDRVLIFDVLGVVRGELIANKTEEEVREGLSLKYEHLTFRTWWVNDVVIDGKVVFHLDVGARVLHVPDNIAHWYEVRELEEIGRRRGLKITIRRAI